MQSEEQRLIDGLFGRLKEAETKTGPRDLGQSSKSISIFASSLPPLITWRRQ